MRDHHQGIQVDMGPEGPSAGGHRGLCGPPWDRSGGLGGPPSGKPGGYHQRNWELPPGKPFILRLYHKFSINLTLSDLFSLFEFIKQLSTLTLLL